MQKKIQKKIYYDLIVIGCGGTGCYFLKEAGRFISALPSDKKAQITSIQICDADIVEAKNLDRQCFVTEDIGSYKACIMANALSDIYGLTNITAHTCYIKKASDINQLIPKRYQDAYRSYIPVIIGCVDNHAARMVIETYFNGTDNCIYFDSANEYVSGEVVYSYKIDGKVLSPTRSTYFPEVLRKSKARSDMSCTELNAVSPQHILANMCAGLNLLAAFSMLIENKRFSAGMSIFNPLLMQNSFVKAMDRKEMPNAI